MGTGCSFEAHIQETLKTRVGKLSDDNIKLYRKPLFHNKIRGSN